MLGRLRRISLELAAAIVTVLTLGLVKVNASGRPTALDRSAQDPIGVSRPLDEAAQRRGSEGNR
jgi:hypothetical protein